MNPVPLFLIIVSLPLLLGGCGEKESVGEVKSEELLAETKPELEGVNYNELEYRGNSRLLLNLFYLKGADTPFTGKAFMLYKNGKKRKEGNFKDGKRDGPITAWHENGQRLREVNYKDSKRDGLEVHWHENGRKKSERNWKDGKNDGLVVGWHENGQKEREGNYKDGKMDGSWVYWHENGRKKSEINWKDGIKVEGSIKYWNSKGEPVATWDEARK